MAKSPSPPRPKFGAGHVGAMARQGLKELRAALYPESNVAQGQEYGLYGTLTPGEVADTRKQEERDANEEPLSGLAKRLAEAMARVEPSRDDRDLNRD